jgi:hypothetical protein
VLFGAQFSDDPHTWAYEVASNQWRDMQPPLLPPTDKNDAVLTYDPVNKIILALVKVTTGEGDAEGHSVQTWSYDAGANQWTRMNPAVEPAAGGNRTRNLTFAPELNLAILENCLGQPREQQIWTYRYADTQAADEPPQAKTPAVPRLVDDVVVSVLSKNRVEVSWTAPATAKTTGYHVERAAVEVWSDDQLTRLKRSTPPLAVPSVGAIRCVGPFQQLTAKPIGTTSFVDDGVDLKSPKGISGQPVYDSDLHPEQVDAAGRGYHRAVFAYRV